MAGITVTAKVAVLGSCRLVVSTSKDFTSPFYGPTAGVSKGTVKLTCSGLANDTTYYCAIEVNGQLDNGYIGTFKTPNTGSHTFKIAFSSCAISGSNHAVFERIILQNPLFFMHLGDIHYEDISTNSPHLFRSGLDGVLKPLKPGRMFREVPTLYMYDDHDYGGNDSNGASLSRDAAVTVFKEQVPHPTLADSGATAANYYSFEIGRILFIVTDLRSEASSRTATDNSSKSKMGTAQKTWFKNLLTNSAGKLVVWFSPTPFITNTTGSADHWGGFNTERVEIANHIKTTCQNRIMVLTGDTHAVAMDDGTNGDFATGGGGAVREFTASPLDQTTSTWPATYSSGYFQNRGSFGIVEFVDTGGSSITVNWTAMLHDGTTITSQSFSMTP